MTMTTEERRAYQREYMRRYRAANPARERDCKKRAYTKQADKWRAYGRENALRYYYENRDAVLAKRQAEYASDPDRFKQLGKARRASGKSSAYERSRYAADIQYRLRKVIRARLCGLRKGGVSPIEGLGCSVHKLIERLNAMMEEGMSWANYGTAWSIDHIYPLSAADLTDRIEFLAVCNWRNLRPLWTQENGRKRAKITDEAAALFHDLKIRMARHGKAKAR